MREWQKLVSVLLDALGDQVAALGHPAWVFVASDPNEDPEAFTLGVGWEPDAFLGGLAPPDWTAVGLVATGTTFVPVPSKQKGYRVRGRSTGRARMACLVTRNDGTFLKAVTSDGRVLEDPPQCGYLLDELRRCMGLPGASIDC